MEDTKCFEDLFTQKIFRIPDYQRGYAWQHEHLKDFWEDLVNLSDGRSHYTGVITLKQIPPKEIQSNSKEYWLVEDHQYKVYHVVDGQQRLTTFIVFIQAFVDFIKNLPEHKAKQDADIYIKDTTINLFDIKSRYLFQMKPKGGLFRTYKFGYTEDNPSYDYLRFIILGEEGKGSIEETFYTLNLNNASAYFNAQISELYHKEGSCGLVSIYKKLTKKLLFNEYIIKEDFDVFIAFETMNNRGKKLSDLELLKNRLIYLTTLYNDHELENASRKTLRDTINDAWREVYHQLGRNKTKPLNDDDFLWAHWVMYFNYSREVGHAYIRFLLDEQFTPKKIYQKTERTVLLEDPKEVRVKNDILDSEEEESNITEYTKKLIQPQLNPEVIRDYVNSLKGSSVHWFNSFYPEFANEIRQEERQWIDRLNRLGMAYFRPLVMAILKSRGEDTERLEALKNIERFIFILFRMTSAKSNYRDSEFYGAARLLDRGEISLADVSKKLNDRVRSYIFDDNGFIRINEFYNIIFNKFKNGSGYYGWSGLRYFLFEYESSLLSESRQKKVDWSDLLKNENDKVSIEHVYPQTESEDWTQCFSSIDIHKREYYSGTIGNLLLLSMSINSSLQNDKFGDKKKVKRDPNGTKIRNGYEDGSHSEIEVAQEPSWGPEQIKTRGLKLLKFMEHRWDFKFKDDGDREKLLFLDFEADKGEGP